MTDIVQEAQQESTSPTGGKATRTASFPATSDSPQIDSIDHRILGNDGLFDHAPDLLNARFPVLSPQAVPGSMPRPGLFAGPQQENRDRVTWGELVVANITYGSAVLGFGIVMYDGISTITNFFWGGIMALVSR